MAYQKSFAALADPNRQAILGYLAQESLSVARLAERFPISRPAVSQHLKVLSDAGLVEAQAQGARRLYRLRRAGMAELRAWIDSLWDDALLAFAEAAENEAQAQQETSK